MAEMKEVYSWLDVCNLDNLNNFFEKSREFGAHVGKIARFYTCEKAGVGECLIAEFHNTNQICLTPYGIAYAIDNTWLKKRIYFKNSAKSFEVEYPYTYGDVDRASLAWVQYLAYLNKNNVKSGETYLQNLKFVCILAIKNAEHDAIKKIKEKSKNNAKKLKYFIDETNNSIKHNKPSI